MIGKNSHPKLFCKKCVLWNFVNFIGKHLCQSFSFNKVGLSLLPQACNFIKKKPLAQMFSCEFYEISKNSFYYRTPLVAASGWARLVKEDSFWERPSNFSVLNNIQCSMFTFQNDHWGRNLYKANKFRKTSVIFLKHPVFSMQWIKDV